ncbi:MAG: hypothetical protein KGH75_08285 [Rhodospirillales bacterium]|nr:hypothetical protein [Rhodospirillales bacterium]
MDTFQAAFNFTVGAEGGYTQNADDPGNWTGGQIGFGDLKGTKYGISAAAYPALDIANLTQAQAEAIYRCDYWPPIRGDELPLPVAMVAFDAAVNSGAPRAIKWLQAAAGVVQDGNFGPVTLAAITKADPVPLASDALAARLVFLTGLASWPDFGLGWTRRVLRLSQAVVS